MKKQFAFLLIALVSLFAAAPSSSAQGYGSNRCLPRVQRSYQHAQQISQLPGDYGQTPCDLSRSMDRAPNQVQYYSNQRQMVRQLNRSSMPSGLNLPPARFAVLSRVQSSWGLVDGPGAGGCGDFGNQAAAPMGGYGGGDFGQQDAAPMGGYGGGDFGQQDAAPMGGYGGGDFGPQGAAPMGGYGGGDFGPQAAPMGGYGGDFGPQNAAPMGGY